MTFELVFENVAADILPDLAKEILGVEAASSCWEVTTCEEPRSGLSLSEALAGLSPEEGGAVFSLAMSIAITNMIICKPFFRILYYEDGIDFEISFRDRDQEFGDGESELSALHQWSSRIARKFKIPAWYFGMEPAADEETRLFTCDDTGPLPFTVLASGSSDNLGDERTN